MYLRDLRNRLAIFLPLTLGHSSIAAVSPSKKLSNWLRNRRRLPENRANFRAER